MKRAPLPGVDLGVYVSALPLLVRNPSIVVVPLLMAVIGVLFARLFSGGDGSGLAGITGGLAGLIVLLLEIFGLGAACIIADDAWRHGRASFDRGWSEARRRGGDILMAAIGITLLMSVAQFTSQILGSIVALVLMALVALFLIWSIPAAAVGGIPGGAAIQVSIERVRANPIGALLLAVVTIVLVFIAAPWAAFQIGNAIFPYVAGTPIVLSLVGALLQAIAFSYIALVMTKTYTDSAFARRW